ncbi:MAG: HIT family protein [Parcubacteria group bacterium SW_6_46_9]|nr:MAG: HIT family protein [Parcubacteria group bacterium SW_6_46_9]
MSKQTIFTKIIAGDIPHHKIYEDESTFAFLDAEPVNPGHTLVVPKEPYQNIYEIPQDDFTKVMETVHRLAPKIKDGVSADGINIGINNEPAAGQEVMHLHVHIMPRFDSDSFSHWQGQDDYHDDVRGKEIAENIREEL